MYSWLYFAVELMLEILHLENQFSSLLTKVIQHLWTLLDLFGVVQLVSQKDSLRERGVQSGWKGACRTLAVHF